MNQEGGHKKLILTILVLILLLIVAGLLIPWNKPEEVAVDTTGNGTVFSPFERPVDRVVDTRSPETPYTYVPTLETPEEIPEEPAIVNSAPRTQSSFYSGTQSSQSFNIPVSTRQTGEVAYMDTSGGIYYVPTYSPSPYYRPTYTYSTSTRPVSQPAAQDDGMTFKELDKEVFGYISGLGWTQLLGDTGQKVYDILYGMSPNGGTGGTIGTFLPGAGGAGGGIGALGGGGIGGLGGGGTAMAFGGQVTRVTQCTCGNSSMLDITEATGQNISLVFQPGVSILYREANINGIGQNVLGNYTAGGACLVYHGEDCTAEGSPGGTITEVGTSK
ncbi:MAG: hypothetical protein RLY66_62 [Candidatus Parcubacteria bacterium]|jgi:hypothetical protein